MIQKLPKTYFTKELRQAKKIIVSENKSFKLKPGYILANSPQRVKKILQKEGLKSTILTGGSTINSAFAKQGLIDEIILNIEPAVIGKGIFLFKSQDFDLRLRLISVKEVYKGIIQLHYECLKNN